MKKKLFMAMLIISFGIASATGSLALENNSAVTPAQPPFQTNEADWLAAEMPLKTWLGISESERIKIARSFVDDYYQTDKTCSLAKIKAFYDEKQNLARIYVECMKRTGPKSPQKNQAQEA
jgi:hypothetical protein